MEINKQLLNDDLKKLRRYFLGHPSNDSIKYDYFCYTTFRDLYETITGIKLEDENLFLRPDRVQELLNNKAYRDCDRFCDYLDEYLYTWYTLFDNYCDELDKVGCIDVPFSSCFRNYSEKDFKDILLGFYSTFGEKEYQLVKRYFDEGRVGTGIKIETGDGMFIGCIHNKSGYIITEQERLNTYTHSILAHEFGHAIDREFFMFPQDKVLPFFNDTFLEVPSAFFEVAFYDYLLRNKIDVDGARIQLNDTFLKVSDSFYPIHRLMRDRADGKDTDVDVYGSTKLQDGEKVDLRDELIYGLGYYTAFCMNRQANGNYKEFMREFYKFIMSRGELTSKQSIEGLGIDFDEFVDGKIITPKIEENTLALKKRFNL